MLGWNLTDDFARNNCTVHTFWLAPSIYSLIFLYNILSLSGGGRPFPSIRPVIRPIIQVPHPGRRR